MTILIFYIDVSMKSGQTNLVVMLKSIEAFKVCRALFADHLGNELFRFRLCFRRDTGQILKMPYIVLLHKKNKS